MLGTIITRVIVPIWLLFGAMMKIVDGSTNNLPAILREVLGRTLGIDLVFVLHYAAAVELVVIGVICLLPSLARTVAISILGIFILILVGDLSIGASVCGCLGSVKIHPLVMLPIDGCLLLGVWFLGERSPSLAWANSLPAWRTVFAGLWALAVFGMSFGLSAQAQKMVADPAQTTQAQPSYYLPDYSAWVGQKWEDIDISHYVQGMPADLATGTQYVLFYRKDCNHCHDLMEFYFGDAPQLPTTIVAVPDKQGFPVEGVLPMHCVGCRLAELPAGTDWFMQTPVLVRLMDGVVECAAETEVSDPECLWL